MFLNREERFEGRNVKESNVSSALLGKRYASAAASTLAFPSVLGFHLFIATFVLHAHDRVLS